MGWQRLDWSTLMIEENDSLYLLQPTFNHSLKKISAYSGHIIWSSPFNDVLKGSGTIYFNPKAKTKKDQIIIFQGSRLGHGNYLDSLPVESFKAVSYDDGSTI